MHGEAFLQDLAMVMLVAGMVTLVFHWLKQPVVLGYLLAGFIIGPFTPPFPLIRDMDTIQAMADMGVVFLMFSLGLDFNLRKLHRVGPSALLIAVFEITVMIVSGYLLGVVFGWSPSDSLFLGLMLSLTSTMIVVKSLRDRGELQTRHAELISGVSLFDDVFVIMLMIALPGFARTGSMPTLDLVLLLAGLVIFLAAAVVVGLLVVPKLLRYIARHTTDETMLVVALGLCFGLALFAVKLGFSAALGAFLVGAIVAESRDVGRVVNLTGPLRDMFCAVFFVAIGMQINPTYLAGSILPAILITVTYLVIKIGACSLGAFLTGSEGLTSMKVGTNMAQIGEFAFILATLAAYLGMSSEFLYPLIVTVAVLNALIRPYLIDLSPVLLAGIVRLLPPPVVQSLSVFRRRVARLDHAPPRPSAMKHVRSLAIQIVLNLALIAGGFIAAGYLHRLFPDLFAFIPGIGKQSKALIWLATAVLLLPLYIAEYRKMQAMAMMLSELMTGSGGDSRTQRAVRRILYGVVFGIQLGVLALATLLVSAAILPAWQTLVVLLVLIALLITLYGRSFNRWYSEAKFSLIATFNEPEPAPPPEVRPMPPQLEEAHLETVALQPGTHEGVLIRELQLRTLTGASIVAIERDGESIINPGPDTELLEGDHVLLLGDRDQLAAARGVLTKSSTGITIS